MRLRAVSLTLATLALGLAPAAAQDFSDVFDQSLALSLSEEARAHFVEAQAAWDRADREDTLDHVALAAEIDTTNVQLQITLADMARRRADRTYGEESLRYYDLSETALRRLLTNPNLGRDERTRVTTASERVRQSKESLRERDDSRMQSGYELMTTLHTDLLERTGIAEKRREIEAIDDVIRVREEEDEITTTRGDVWPAFNAPGLAIDIDRIIAQTQQIGGWGPYAGGADPFGGAGFAPGAMGFDPGSEFGAGYAADPYGGAPAANPWGAPPADPWGAPPAADPWSTPADPTMGGGGWGAPGAAPAARPPAFVDGAK